MRPMNAAAKCGASLPIVSNLLIPVEAVWDFIVLVSHLNEHLNAHLNELENHTKGHLSV